MTSFSWFSGKRESSRKYMGNAPFNLFGKVEEKSEGGGADDSRALHLADGGPVVLHGVVLRRAVVPDGEAVRRPAPAHLVLGDERLPNQVVEQLARARRVVEPEPHVLRRVPVDEMGGERVDEKDLLVRFGVGPHDRVLGVGEPDVQATPLLRGPGRT